MRNTLLISVLLLVFSCNKDENNGLRELDIQLKSVSNVTNIASHQPNIYPNPCYDYFTLTISGYSDSDYFIINNEKGDFKKLYITGNVSHFAISQVSDGIYYIEIHVGNKIYYEKLIKVSPN